MALATWWPNGSPNQLPNFVVFSHAYKSIGTAAAAPSAIPTGALMLSGASPTRGATSRRAHGQTRASSTHAPSAAIAPTTPRPIVRRLKSVHAVNRAANPNRHHVGRSIHASNAAKDAKENPRPHSSASWYTHDPAPTKRSVDPPPKASAVA